MGVVDVRQRLVRHRQRPRPLPVHGGRLHGRNGRDGGDRRTGRVPSRVPDGRSRRAARRRWPRRSRTRRGDRPPMGDPVRPAVQVRVRRRLALRSDGRQRRVHVRPLRRWTVRLRRRCPNRTADGRSTGRRTSYDRPHDERVRFGTDGHAVQRLLTLSGLQRAVQSSTSVGVLDDKHRSVVQRLRDHQQGTHQVSITEFIRKNKVEPR